MLQSVGSARPLVCCVPLEWDQLCLHCLHCSVLHCLGSELGNALLQEGMEEGRKEDCAEMQC